MVSWFPRPAHESDVVLLHPCGPWTAAAVLALLKDPGGEEWRHKVGVVGRADGSAKPTVRLLAAGGFVCKTSVDHTFPSEEEARAYLLGVRVRGRNAGIWHPDKIWAVMRCDEAWFPLTVCRELVTLRQVASLRDRRLAWVEMIRTGVEIYRLHGCGLDLNPANFGREPTGGPLHYLDDELYERLDERNVAGAIVARIPEEPAAGLEAWRELGVLMRAGITLGRELSWERLAREVREYPLPERFEERRAALAATLEVTAPEIAPGPGPRELVAVLADVHGNLPALEAVLAHARAQGVSRYLFLGDAVGYGPHPGECVRRLAELPRAWYVSGNHDHAIATGRLERGMNRLARACADWTRAQLAAAELAWLEGLPLERREDDWLAVHGAPRDPARFLAYVYDLTYEDNLRWLREREIALCFHGHTHVQLAHVEIAAGPSKLAGARAFRLDPRQTWMVNPGSVGQPRDGDVRAAYALWDRRSGEIMTVRVEYDVGRTLDALQAAALPWQLAQRLRAGL